MLPMFRREVLSLYRRIFRLARQWQATTAADTEVERQYIRDEARKLFRGKKDVSIISGRYSDLLLRKKLKSQAGELSKKLFQLTVRRMQIKHVMTKSQRS